MHMRITIGTQTMPLPDEATKPHPFDSQTKVHTTSPKDNQTLSQQDYSPFCSKHNDIKSDSESEYVSDEATTAQPLMLKNTNSWDKSRDSLSQDDRHQIAIVSQLASLKSNIYALNTKLYASANGIVSTTMSIPWGPCTVATQTQDPHQHLAESIEIFLATAQDEFTIDPQAQAAALLYGYSVQTDITQDTAY